MPRKIIETPPRPITVPEPPLVGWGSARRPAPSSTPQCCPITPEEKPPGWLCCQCSVHRGSDAYVPGTQATCPTCGHARCDLPGAAAPEEPPPRPIATHAAAGEALYRLIEAARTAAPLLKQGHPAVAARLESSAAQVARLDLPGALAELAELRAKLDLAGVLLDELESPVADIRQIAKGET